MEDKNISIYNNRLPLLSWLILPIILIWFTANYLIGILRPPSWQATVPANTKILSNITKQIAPATIPLIPKYQWNGIGLITLWFDDAWLSQYTIAFPMLGNYGYRAALAVPTHVLEFDAYMGVAEVKRLQAEGWEITSHTRTHDCNLLKETEKTIESELTGAQEDLKKMGLESNNFVSPCGVNSPLVTKIAKKYYLSLRTTESGVNPIPVTNPYNLLAETVKSTTTLKTVKSWIKKAADEHKWLILVFHQIDDPSSDYSITATMLHNILDELKKNNIAVILPTQAMELAEPDIKISTPSATPSKTQFIQSKIQ
jgi:peptidoglycan/xylan/chitin deacetylase (PgdA/CDA1 family)